ncbi:MAG: dihydroneopterin aldolase [Betaproteobacteria bacterium]|nr:dihydroneopterin aldolase [Betaproteobacteria bacterium]
MNTIFIQDLRLTARIGIYAWERGLPQTLQLDLELGLASDKGVPQRRLQRCARLRGGRLAAQPLRRRPRAPVAGSASPRA